MIATGLVSFRARFDAWRGCWSGTVDPSTRKGHRRSLTTEIDSDSIRLILVVTGHGSGAGTARLGELRACGSRVALICHCSFGAPRLDSFFASAMRAGRALGGLLGHVIALLLCACLVAAHGHHGHAKPASELQAMYCQSPAPWPRSPSQARVRRPRRRPTSRPASL